MGELESSNKRQYVRGFPGNASSAAPSAHRPSRAQIPPRDRSVSLQHRVFPVRRTRVSRAIPFVSARPSPQLVLVGWALAGP
eukprot:740072-Prymnesium_polylepis.2